MNKISRNAEIFRKLRTQNKEEFFADKELDIFVIGDFHRTLLQEAIAFKKNDIAAELIARSIDVNATDSKGQTALHYGAVYGAYEVVRDILLSGGSPNIPDKFGNGAAWTAALSAKGDYSILKLLVAYGAEIDSKNRVGKSVLDFARQSDDLDMWLACGESENDFKKI